MHLQHMLTRQLAISMANLFVDLVHHERRATTQQVSLQPVEQQCQGMQSLASSDIASNIP